MISTYTPLPPKRGRRKKGKKNSSDEESDSNLEFTPEQQDMLRDFVVTDFFISAEVTATSITTTPKFDDGVYNIYPFQPPTYHRY